MLQLALCLVINIVILFVVFFCREHMMSTNSKKTNNNVLLNEYKGSLTGLAKTVIPALSFLLILIVVVYFAPNVDLTMETRIAAIIFIALVSSSYLYLIKEFSRD